MSATARQDRYDRQMLVPGVGLAGQARLAAAHVAVVGAGGLGSAVLPALAGAGVGRITILDPDRVSLSNLHRQTLYAEADIGAPKAIAAARHLAARNSGIAIDSRPEALTPANAATLTRADVVLDCADMFAVSYTLSDACLAAGVPMVSASVLGLAGYCGGFCGGAPSLRAVFPDLPAQAASCATAGVLGPVVAMIGAAQAQMALAVILGLVPSPLGQVVTMDAGSWRLGGFRFDHAPEPDTGWRFVDAGAVAPDDVAIELRGADEGPLFHPAALRHAPDAVPVPGDTARRAVLACRTGLRAWRAATRLSARWPGEIVLVATGDPLTQDPKESP